MVFVSYVGGLTRNGGRRSNLTWSNANLAYRDRLFICVYYTFRTILLNPAKSETVETGCCRLLLPCGWCGFSLPLVTSLAAGLVCFPLVHPPVDPSHLFTFTFATTFRSLLPIEYLVVNLFYPRAGTKIIYQPYPPIQAAIFILTRFRP